MRKLLFAALLIAGGVSVAPAPVASATGPCMGPPGVNVANSPQCAACMATAPDPFNTCFTGRQPPVASGPVGPGRNQHCNSLLNGAPGNDNRGLYIACCHDAALGGGGPQC